MTPGKLKLFCCPWLRLGILAVSVLPFQLHPTLASVQVFYDTSARPVGFAISEIRRALAARGQQLLEYPLNQFHRPGSQLTFVITATPSDSKRIAELLAVRPLHSTRWQAYSIRKKAEASGLTIAVLAADSLGAMYGGLDLAEAIAHGTVEQLGDSDHDPYIERRGIKFNIPLDARTPSYSDNSDAAQNNIPVMWDFDFWREFLDEMARCRFNVLTLWNLHPFPSLVKVPEYPDVALNDVMRTTVPMDDSFRGNGSDMVRPEILENLEVVRKMTIDEKIQFWRDVIQYAHDRGIEVYWFTWNIFTWGATGKYGITPDQDNPRTIDYFRATIREMVLTYPLLAGFGITAGENMQNRDDEFSKEKWLWRAYGEGIRDAMKLQPGRDIRLIHRFHQTALSQILQEWQQYPGTFELSFKYAIAHMYSIPNPPFIKEALPFLSPKLRTWLTVRDDDYYSFRNGDPDYARDFIRNMPVSVMAGYYIGPDGYIWGREFLSKNPDRPRQLVIKKRWFNFRIWGRLSYEPDLPNALFEQMLAARFPQVPARTLYEAFTTASKIFPQMTRFFWGDIDVRWFPEACLSHPRWRGFYTVRDFILQPTMPGSNILNILEWRRRHLNGESIRQMTPLQVADNLQKYSEKTLQLVHELRSAASSDKELRETLGDFKAMAHLGLYYAEKIRGAAYLALFDKTDNETFRQQSIEHLRRALSHWLDYSSAYLLQYEQPKLYNRVGWVNIPALKEKVQQDIHMVETWKSGTIPDTATLPRQADRPFRR